MRPEIRIQASALTRSPAPTGLYLHVPFCIRRCLYCDFYVEPLGTGSISSRLKEFRNKQHSAFLEAIALELGSIPKTFRPATVYLGGGTPTEMPPTELERLFASISQSINLRQVTEFSCEANPGTMDAGMADLLVRSGVNRVSLGVQSFNDNCLELLGRIHDASGARETVHQLRASGVSNLSVDLLFGLPETDIGVTQENLAAIEELQPEHVSWYSLEYEEGTGLTQMRDKGFLEESSDEQTAEEYEQIIRGLQHLGYEQYELFSFAKPGHRCAHNRNYWQGGGFYGCGPSAYSHVDGERRSNVRDLGSYIHKLKHGESPVDFRESLSAEAKAREQLVIGLRQTEGISRPEFETKTGYGIQDLAGCLLEEWEANGFLFVQGDRLALTPKAYLISDSLFRDLVTD